MADFSRWHDRIALRPGRRVSTVLPPRIRSYAPFLAACEAQLEATVARTRPALTGPAMETLQAGGKRLRPLLVYCCGGEGEEARDALTSAAVAVELVHMATLVHDDVLDGSDLRRGQPTVVHRHGRELAVQTGDFLFATAFGELAQTGSASAVSTLAAAARDLANGEIAQTNRTRDLGVSVEEYLERVRLKTASLFSAACRLGAEIGGGGEEADLLGEYGTRIGIAFQILDDILDVASPEEITGKPRGADLRDGTVTLPMIIAMREEPGLRERIAGAMNGEPAEEVCRLLAQHPATDAARSAALDLVEQAHEIARNPVLRNSDGGALEEIANGVADRYA